MGRRSLLIAIILIVFAIVFTTFFIASRLQSGKKTPTANKDAQAKIIEDDSVKLSSIVNDPLVFRQSPVIINSQINDWVTERSFTLSEATQGGFFGSRNVSLLLVISDLPFDLPQHASGNELARGEEGVNVKITGTVHILNRDQLEEKIRVDLDGEFIRLDDSDIEKWTLGPVLYLESAEKVE